MINTWKPVFYYSLIFISSSKIKTLIRCLKTNKSIYKFHWQQQQHKLILRVSQCRSFQWNLLLQHCKLGFQLPRKTLNLVAKTLSNGDSLWTPALSFFSTKKKTKTKNLQSSFTLCRYENKSTSSPLADFVSFHFISTRVFHSCCSSDYWFTVVIIFSGR